MDEDGAAAKAAGDPAVAAPTPDDAAGGDALAFAQKETAFLLEENERLRASLSEAWGQVESLRASLAAQKGQTTRVRVRVAAFEAEQGKPRKLGPLANQGDTAELMEALAAAEMVHLAFSDGKREVAGLAPREIVGGGFVVVRGRVKLDVPSLLVHGPAPGQSAFLVGGYALLADGKPIAFAARSQLAIGPGQQVELKDDVIF